MDAEVRGLADWFVARHTIDPVLPNQLPFSRASSNRPTETLLENAEPAVITDIALPARASAGFMLFQNLSTNSMESAAHNWPQDMMSRATRSESTRRNQNQPTEANYSAGNLDEQLLLTSLPPCIRNHTVESVESTNNSSLASEQRVSRATALLHRVMEEREEEQVQFRREMNRREQEIRERKERERIERELREMEEASYSRWPEQQEAITVPCCTCPMEEITYNKMCGNSQRQGSTSKGPVTNRGHMFHGQTFSVQSTDNSLLALKQRAEEVCALVERVLGEREEREIREQRALKKRGREAREIEEASRWPQQQEAITGRSQWLCEHYQRHSRVLVPYCSQFHSCYRCHHNSKACDSEEAKASHATDHLKCLFCHHEQETAAKLSGSWCTCPNENQKTAQDSICRRCGRRK